MVGKGRVEQDMQSLFNRISTLVLLFFIFSTISHVANHKLTSQHMKIIRKKIKGCFIYHAIHIVNIFFDIMQVMYHMIKITS